MRNLISIVFLLLIPVLALGQLLPVQKQDTALYNYIINPGFENGRGSWTISGGSSSMTSSGANLLTGSETLSWTPTGSQTITQSLTIPNGLYGRNGVARISWKGGDGNYTFYITDGTNVISNTVTLSASTNKSTEFVTFIYPTSGSVVFTLAASGASTQIHIDDTFMGENYLLSNITQAEFYGGATTTGATNCDWSSTSGSYAVFAADTDCNSPTVVGNASAPGTKIPGIVFSSLRPGRYMVVLQGNMYAALSTTSTQCNYTLSDGTNTAGYTYILSSTTASTAGFTANTLIGYFTYSTAQSNITFQLQTARSAGDGSCRLANVSSTLSSLQISVYRFPLSSETAYTPDVSSWKIDANITYTSSLSLGGSDITSYTAPSAADGTLTARSYSAPVGISCSSTNENSVGSTTCSSGSEEVGVVFNAPRSGLIQCTAQFSHFNQFNASTDDIFSVFQLVRTPNNAQTITEEGGSRIQSGTANTSATGMASIPNSVVGRFNLTSAGKTTIRLMYEQDVNGTPAVNVISSDASGSYGQRDIRITCEYVDNTIPMPNIVNSVSSQYSGQVRVEQAQLNCDASSAISAQRGQWISSIGNISTGACTVTVDSGMFSSTPTCIVSGITTLRIFDQGSSTPTSVVMRCLTDAGASCTSFDAFLTCVGPK